MKYYLIERQSGGCDYTIGCGIRVSALNVATREEARELVAGVIGEYWRHPSEVGIEKAELLEVTEAEDLGPFLDARAAERAGEKKRQRQTEEEVEERILLERLKKKYEG